MDLHLTPALDLRLERLAEVSGRTKDDLAAEALSSYLAYVEALAKDVREAEEEADQEGWLSHEEVFKRFHTLLNQTA